MVNAAFLSTATDANAAAEGRNGTSWNRDTFCLSSGPTGSTKPTSAAASASRSSVHAAKATTSRT